MKDLFGRDVRPTFHQGDLLAGHAGLGVEAVSRVVDGIEYVRTESGYYVRADGTGGLLLETPSRSPLPVGAEGIPPETFGMLSNASSTKSYEQASRGPFAFPYGI